MEIMDLAANSLKERVLVLLLMDASTSMRRYGNTPIKAIKQYIKSLIKANDGKSYYVGIIGFNYNAFKIMELNEASQINLETLEYELAGGTRLYNTVDETLRDLLSYWWEKMDPQRDKIVVGVFSDGWDRFSNEETQPQSCQFMSQSATCLGWNLQAFGIGINGQQLAKNLGFPEANGHTVSASRQGIMDASATLCGTTLGGHNVDPQDFVLKNSYP